MGIIFHQTEKEPKLIDPPVTMESRKWQLGFFALAHVFIFTTIFHTIYNIQYTAIGMYFNFASKVISGSVPYRDFVLEYPPFSLFFFILPRLVTSSYPLYALLYQAEVVIIDLAAVFVIYDIARRLGKSPWKTMTVYTVGILAAGPIITQQFDVFPALMVLLAIYFFWLGKNKTSWAILALGVVTKIYPIVLAPVFLIYYFRSKEYRNMRSGIITFALVGLATTLPLLLISPGSILELINYHSQRGIEIESIYSSFLLIAEKLGFVSAQAYFSFGSWNIVGNVESAFAGASTFLLVLCLLIAYWIVYTKTNPRNRDLSSLSAFSTFLITLVLITSKILSPQYIIWLIPLLPLLTFSWRYAVWAVFVAIGCLTFYIFPSHYYELIDFKSTVVAALFIRNILLILLAALIGTSLFRMSPHFKWQYPTKDKSNSTS